MSSLLTMWSPFPPLTYRLPISFPRFLAPFLQLSYPVAPPSNPDSFPNSNYYDIGPLDACFIISTMAVFAVLREIVRLKIMTPFANKVLFGSTSGYRPLYRRSASSSSTSLLANGKSNGITANGTNGLSNGNGFPSTGTLASKLNGNGNGHGHANGNGNGAHHYAARRMSAKNRVRERNVIRFAEQGWAIVYYTIWFSYGVVSPNAKPGDVRQINHPPTLTVYPYINPDISLELRPSVDWPPA
jgi:acyl-CoA-dependent ceramide synthase